MAEEVRKIGVLAVIANHRAGPIIDKYLMENRGVKSVSFVAHTESDALNQRSEGVEAAGERGQRAPGCPRPVLKVPAMMTGSAWKIARSCGRRPDGDGCALANA